MKGKLLFLAGTATGFVLGSKAGRQAYDRIAAKAHEMWGDTATQKVISQAETIAHDAASVAQTKVSDLLDRTEASVRSEEHNTHPATDAGTREM
jgi:gas vesicle protein